MTDSDIRDYIEGCEQPIFMKDVLSELRSTDPTISQKRVARLMREAGFENRPCKNVRNPKGKGSAWFRTGNATTIDDDDDEVDETEEKPEPKSTEQIIDEVEERNEHTTSLNAKLLETLNVSRGLKAEMIARQQEVLVDMARRILGLYGSEKERKAYGVL
jgi:histone H3/H4